eukprot:CAMPEP_0172385680 /NCGR_PEP_ID=MMETSP1061-20121228/3292_1 /TAXON_ID=37318 /ORGANISM="Pseudo-nitzschia pungens, Strain cf. pungens" /LENGTH=1145 /DNA_ID=CAMNT_0013114773 /DNA_START=426 /DNA_END=3863 /DNA_ORIENTATION=+
MDLENNNHNCDNDESSSGLRSLSDTSEHASTCTANSSRFDDSRRRREKLKQMKIADTEEKQVKIIRIVTFSFIFFASIAVSLVVFLFAVNFDKNEFESEYNAFVESIQRDVVWEVKYNLALLKQLSSVITSEIMASNQSAPFVTIPNFEVTGGFTEGMGGMVAIVFAPLLRFSEAASLREEWEAYSVQHKGWLEESAKLKIVHTDHLRPLEGTHQDHETDLLDAVPSSSSSSSEQKDSVIQDIPENIWYWEGDERVALEQHENVDEEGERLVSPLWHNSPPDAGTVNVDLLSDPRIVDLYQAVVDTNQTLMSATTEIGNLFDWVFAPEEKHRKKEPHTFILERVFADFGIERELETSGPAPSSEPIGIVLGLTSYRHLFERILPEGANGIYCVLEGTDACGTNLTYLINGPEAVFVGYNDLHEGMNEYKATFQLELYDTITESICVHDIHIYPTPGFKAAHTTNRAAVYTGIVVLAFAVTTFCFLIYERLVTKREKTKTAALHVVASLFPSDVQDRVLKGVHDGLQGESKEGSMIASFFPNTTVMFADIAGFTAWSSTREPEQVFHLLETVYGAMDQIAMRRGVFKVETVGDCYVAVCGLPEAREDHAVAMARFARDCQLRMVSLGQQLEIALGPDTADLSFRIGMHSGPVTGGVLRGQNARFQLFGDTMNQASRMESTGVKNRIQMSVTTARLLIDRGKGKWVEKRPEKVDVKGKGLQETYFFKQIFGKHDASSVASTSETETDTDPSDLTSPENLHNLGSGLSSKTHRLIKWNTEVLSRRIKSILQCRENSLHAEISNTVADQLHRHVLEIACMYRDNPFHNYEHASHVTLSMEKMLSRVERDNETIEEYSMNRYTNDIATDPLAQFAVVYSALIHDVDHTGVSNSQLVKEKDDTAVKYHGKSPAENHSIHIAWTTLLKPEYNDLFQCLCPSASEKVRLHRLVVNAVLATDIFDEDLKESRNYRWKQVFGESVESDTPTNKRRDVDALRVMIVLEHLIQASDVAHTMQHWHVYIKWNERLFQELNEAYQNGRMGKDPTEFWYEGELGFFDHYVIPLAKKLRECAVFGVTCDELLNYAETNRSEWEAKGRDIVRDYALRFQRQEENVEDKPFATSDLNWSRNGSNSSVASKMSTPVRMSAALAA